MPAMRISMGHVDVYDDIVAAYARQLGLRSVQLHTPSNLPSDQGFWALPDLSALVDRCHRDDLELEGLENVPVRHFGKIQQGLPGRDEQIENYQRTVRNLGAAGIPLLGYHFMIDYVWRTALGGAGRGGARVTAFDVADVPAGNALATYKLTPDEVPRGFSADEVWANHQYFLDAVLPVAEEAGVRLCLHPDDPPLPDALGGAARIFTSPAALERAWDTAGRSPAWGLNFCVGTVSEMNGQVSVLEVIDRLGAEGIAYVHFRDVVGTVPVFREAFLGEGNLDAPAVIKRLHEVGFDGFLIDDHVPAMIGDLDTWGDTSPEAYCSRGRAHAIGYLQGVFDALGIPRS